MENWKLAVIILVAILVGALIPIFIALARVLFRAAREITEIGKQLKPTLDQLQIISGRVETLSRGFEGGEQNIADLLAVVGELAQGVHRSMKIFNISSAVAASVGPAVSAFVSSMRQSKQHGDPVPTNCCGCPADAQPSSSSSAEARAG